MDRYAGTDNYGKLKTDYLARIAAMDDAALGKECESTIWLSAYAANNPRSDYHWHVDACYDECQRRAKASIYEGAYDAVSKSV